MNDKNKKLVSVIIVNYETEEHLKKCLESLSNSLINVTYEIIVVDNNSSERGIEELAKQFVNVKFVFNKENHGFGSGCNVGAQIAGGKYLAFVNPDTVFFEDPFTPLFEHMELNPKTGVCSGVLENAMKNLVYTFNDFPGLSWEIRGAAGKGENRKILRLLKNPKILNRSNIPLNVDWVVGAFMFFRADLFASIDGFDEDFFLYYEDVDIQKRVKSLNMKVEVLPNIRICHNERSSVRSFKGENLYYFHMMRSRLIYFYKHSNSVKRNIIRLLHICGVLLRYILLPFRSEFKGKKQQKYFQYRMMLNLLFLNFNKLLNKEMPDCVHLKYPDTKDTFIKDKFWN
jgi:GT2 family glycosyltransferase